MKRFRCHGLPAPDAGACENAPRAIVVFEDRCAGFGFRWLRSGFRHCFCLLRRPAGWVVCDPVKSRTRLEVVAPYEERALLSHYRERNMIALVGTCLDVEPGRLALRPLTCVEVVKRVIGLHAPMVWTPHQLYRALRRAGFEGPPSD